MTEFLQVKDWDSLQQYKDRDPKWIKLHRDLLDDYEIDGLDELAQIHLVKIWLLAAKLGNKIPNDAKWIARKIGAQSEVKLDQLVTKGFLLPYKPVQDRTEVYLEEEGEREEEKEKEEKIPPSVEDESSGDLKKEIFDLAIETLCPSVSERQARSLAGQLLKTCERDETEAFIALRDCQGKKDPPKYLAACIRDRKKECAKLSAQDEHFRRLAEKQEAFYQ